MEKLSPALAEGPTVTEAMKRAGAFAGAAYGHPKLFHPDGEMLGEIYTAMHAARPTADLGEDGELVEQVISGWAFAHNIDGAARNDLFKRLRSALLSRSGDD